MKEQSLDPQNSWEIRNISMMGDKANLGLAESLDGEIDKSLLQEGVRFCDLVSGLIAAPPPSGSLLERSIKGREALMKEIINLELVGKQGITLEKISEQLKEIKNVFESILTSPETKPRVEQVAHAQELLGSISSAFYRTDIANLRAMKEKRSLKAYG